MKMPTEDSDSAPLTLESNLPAADQVRAGLAKLQANPKQTELVLWLLQYGVESRGAKSRGDLANLIGSSPSTISKIFSGTYEGSLEAVTSKIRAFRGGAGLEKSEWPIARTKVASDIWAFCDATRNARQMSLLWGPNQSGKSHALKSYAAAPREARTFYVFMPAGGGTNAFMKALARACGLSVTVNYQPICEAVLGFLRPGDLLIVDEYHQTLIGRCLKTVTIEKIKELFEQCGCAILLCGTDVIPKMMENERHQDFLAQTANRGALRRRIPARPYKADIAAAFDAYGFPQLTGPALTKAEEVGATNGLGKIFRQLQLAVILARNKKQDLSLDHYTTTVRTMAKWEEGADPNDSWEGVQ